MLAATAITGKKPRKLTIVKNSNGSGEKTKTTYTIERTKDAHYEPHDLSRNDKITSKHELRKMKSDANQMSELV